MLIAGFVLSSYPYTSPAWRNQRRVLPVVDPKDLERSIQGYRSGQQSEQFTFEYLEGLRPDIMKGLSFFHDYRQINTQIIQNINAHLEEKYPYLSKDEQLEEASHYERAIFQAAKFLEEKLNVARFLVDEEGLLDREACARFRVHGLVTTYIKIYQSRFEERNIRVSVSGSSYSATDANRSACAVIPHTILDNAVKYAPEGSRVEVLIQDVPAGVQFEVSSFGPLITPDEEAGIFGLFVRGAAAKRMSEEGAGYGLYVSQLIARQHLGTEVSVRQNRERKWTDGRVWTTFSVTFPQVAVILEDT